MWHWFLVISEVIICQVLIIIVIIWYFVKGVTKSLCTFWYCFKLKWNILLNPPCAALFKLKNYTLPSNIFSYFQLKMNNLKIMFLIFLKLALAWGQTFLLFLFILLSLYICTAAAFNVFNTLFYCRWRNC